VDGCPLDVQVGPLDKGLQIVLSMNCQMACYCSGSSA